ncbi:hypothetical protein ABE10_02780, partial [Bacillus toyonensis]|nr:hypothetical protein [Bacillus toyonensis]
PRGRAPDRLERAVQDGARDPRHLRQPGHGEVGVLDLARHEHARPLHQTATTLLLQAPACGGDGQIDESPLDGLELRLSLRMRVLEDRVDHGDQRLPGRAVRGETTGRFERAQRLAQESGAKGERDARGRDRRRILDAMAGVQDDPFPRRTGHRRLTDPDRRRSHDEQGDAQHRLGRRGRVAHGRKLGPQRRVPVAGYRDLRLPVRCVWHRVPSDPGIGPGQRPPSLLEEQGRGLRAKSDVPALDVRSARRRHRPDVDQAAPLDLDLSPG